MTRSPRLTAAGALALALALAGCGGSSSSDDPTLAETSPSAAAPAPTQDASSCPTTITTIPAPASVSTDLEVRPKVPANAAAPATGVQVADVVVGTGPVAGAGSTVQVKYVGALDKTGVEFDASWNRQAPDDLLSFSVCGQEVVPGFSVAPLGMKVGGRRLVRIPDQFGYAGGNPQAGIPAGAVITFVIDLVSVA